MTEINMYCSNNCHLKGNRVPWTMHYNKKLRNQPKHFAEKIHFNQDRREEMAIAIHTYKRKMVSQENT